MAKADPEQERRRLAEFYAGQTDGELEKVASQAYELTDLARGALRSELFRRGLTPSLAERPPLSVRRAPSAEPGDPPLPDALREDAAPVEGELEFRDMVAIRKFRDLPEALLAKGSLESAGIDCALVDDNVVRLDWFWSNLMGGVKLLVDRENLAAAEEILTQPIPEHFDVSGVGEYEQPRCPSCGSLDVNFRETSPAAFASAFLVGIPIPLVRKAWRCHACRAEWKEDAASSAPDAVV
jgi:hypothetical protein